MTIKPEDFLPKDAIFERAPILPHDEVVKPSHKDGIHLDGDSSKGQAVEYLHFHDDKFTHEIRKDVSPTLDWVKEQHLDKGSSAGKSKSGEWYHAARVDEVVILAWLNARGLKWSDFKGDIVDNFLNDPENKAFRVWQGSV